MLDDLKVVGDLSITKGLVTKLEQESEKIYLCARHEEYFKLGDSHVTFIMGKGRWKGSEDVIDVYLDGRLAFYMQYQKHGMKWCAHVVDISLTSRIVF